MFVWLITPFITTGTCIYLFNSEEQGNKDHLWCKPVMKKEKSYKREKYIKEKNVMVNKIVSLWQDQETRQARAW